MIYIGHDYDINDYIWRNILGDFGDYTISSLIFGCGSVSLFNGISIFVGYLMPKPLS